MCVNNLPKVATQWNSGATRDSNRGRGGLLQLCLPVYADIFHYPMSRLQVLLFNNDELITTRYRIYLQQLSFATFPVYLNVIH